ncbi:hypothetical protein Ddye_024588 [Dipteronia dyeriana]|uniref:Transposase Tnp1/En/Spm-like domain-containing protein n=1 Tax=Dipteronia dyeriana TaxID=168575 RepID=A0AAD9WUL2_9ROSI|nr:hypothetical protein Ddye_024588 [Dipteronia dyeriana]
MDDEIAPSIEKDINGLILREGKIVVETNEDGVPHGEGYKSLIKNLGKFAQTTIPITYNDWRIEPARHTDALWEYVVKFYWIDHRLRKRVLQSIGIMFRNWRSALSTKYIIPQKSDPEILKEPPLELPHIPKSDWVVFVNERISEKFQNLREKNSKRRKSYKHNHRLSRGGYVSMKERLEELRKKSDAESLSFDGENDILTVALRTKEHGGQVRGMEKFITSSFYFNAIHLKDRWIEEKKSSLARISSLEETVASLTQTTNQTMGTPSSATSVDCHSSNKIQHVEGAKVIIEESNHVDGEKCVLSLGEPCKLIVRRLENVVATGTIIIKDLKFMHSCLC